MARRRFQCRLAAVWRRWQHYSSNVGNIILPLLARRRIRCCSLQFAVRCWLAAVPMLVSCSFPTPGRRWKHYSAIVGPIRFRCRPAAECQCWLNAGLWCKTASPQHWLQRWAEVDNCWQLHLANMGPTMQCLLGSRGGVLKNRPVLGSRTALFFQSLKFCWKTPETSRKNFEYLFCFPQLEHRRSQRGGRGNPPLQLKFHR